MSPIGVAPSSVTFKVLSYPLDAADAFKLSRFLNDAYADRYGEFLAFKCEEYWNWLYGAGGQSLVLEDGDRIIGHLGCVPFVAIHNRRRRSGTWGADMFVLPEYRKNGYGTCLQTAAQASHPLFSSMFLSASSSRIKIALGQEIVTNVAVLVRVHQDLPEGPRWQVGPPVPHEIADAARTYLEQWDFFVERSVAYCTWRFLDQPSANYRQVRCNDGLSLIRPCGPKRSGVGMIGDAFPAANTNEALAGVLDAASRQLFADGCEVAVFGCSDASVTDFLLQGPWSLRLPAMALHLPNGSVAGRIFLSLSDQDIDQYPGC